MISKPALGSALGRVSLWRFFPSSNPDAMVALGEVFKETCGGDEQLKLAVTVASRECSGTWPGLGEFQRVTAEAVAPIRQPKCTTCRDSGFVYLVGGYEPCICAL